MKFYINELDLKPYKDHFVLSHEVAFWVDDEEFQIPRNMSTDLASIPKLFRWLFDRFGISTVSWVVHDFGYRIQPKGKNRKFWDDLNKFMIKKDGKSKIEVFFIYRTLRLCGWIAWNNNSKNKVLYE